MRALHALRIHCQYYRAHCSQLQAARPSRFTSAAPAAKGSTRRIRKQRIVSAAIDETVSDAPEGDSPLTVEQQAAAALKQQQQRKRRRQRRKRLLQLQQQQQQQQQAKAAADQTAAAAALTAVNGAETTEVYSSYCMQLYSQQLSNGTCSLECLPL